MINRRGFVKNMGWGMAGAAFGAMIPWPGKNREAGAGLKKNFEPDVDIALKAAPGTERIISGNPTGVWRFEGELKKGDPGNLIPLKDSYLGPIIRVRRGQKVRVRFLNGLGEPSIVHWHGLNMPADMDGHPRLVVPGGGAYLYEFEVHNRAGTYWYHPHPHGRTGPQVYGGLAGLFIVTDEEEEALDLPSGEFELPLVIQDRTFGPDNGLVYLGHMMDRMLGFLGERIMINGRPDFVQSVANRPYRLRLLNGSNSRVYRLAWSDGSPLVIIGNDGGLLEKPVRRGHLMFGPGQRLDLWADFSAYKKGDRPTLVSLPFDDGSPMARGAARRGIIPYGGKYDLVEFYVERENVSPRALPETLSKIEHFRESEAVAQKRFTLAMAHMTGLINGRTYGMDDVAEDEKVIADSLEQWEFENLQGRGMGMMGNMVMPHPMHLHGRQFQVVERRGGLEDGFLDEGWIDTTLVMPGQRVRILVRFGEYEGLFIYHCHNLEHEDMGMMRNYLVRKPGSAESNPLTGA